MRRKRRQPFKNREYPAVYKLVPTCTSPPAGNQVAIPHLYSMNKFSQIARFLFAIAIAVFGIQHLLYAHFILEPWPAWVPLQPFLAYVTGLLHIAIAFSILIQKKDWQAALLLGLF